MMNNLIAVRNYLFLSLFIIIMLFLSSLKEDNSSFKLNIDNKDSFINENEINQIAKYMLSDSLNNSLHDLEKKMNSNF